jgi:prepilin-type N-terminal cleavage/methylation domain-containing protein
MRNNKTGFTVLELMISMAIMSIALTSIYGLYMSYVRVYTTEGVTSRVQQGVRAGMDMMVRDIRMAGLDPTGTDRFGMVEASAQSIRFTADRDMDGEIDDPDLSGGFNESNLEQIAFTYDAGTNLLEMILYKSDDTIESRDTMLENVSNLNFTYLNADDGVTADLNEIRTVIIALTVQKPAGRGDPVSRTLTKRIRCRNLDY